ncbi:MAG: FkbM family methyltransferase [bacterium]|nr:MAG: FkbM family methyltransferase [bacterium]
MGAKKLKRNVELNNFGNIVIENVALSHHSVTEKISFRSSWRLDHELEENSRNLQDVRFITLDEYVEDKDIKQIDFIKLDVDGYEYKFLLGAKEVLEKFKPTIIMELGDYTLKRTGDKIEDMIAFLLSLGYEFYSERSMAKFSDKDLILDSIPNRDKFTINVVLLHKEANTNA